MTKALIYKPAKTAMQSGIGGTKEWVLEYIPQTPPHFTYFLMGWTGGTNTTEQIKLHFSSIEAAVTYAENHHIPYTVRPPKMHKTLPKSYADNFRYDKVEA